MYSREQKLAIDAIGQIQCALMDEDPGIDRPDIWSASWAELQAPAEDIYASDYHSRQMAHDQIYSFYMHSLTDLYPQLLFVDSMEAMMMEMALIPDLPECDGNYTESHYLTADGRPRMMSYVEVRLGDAMGVCASIIDTSSEPPKAYVVGLKVDGSLWGNAGTADERDMVEDDILRKVHHSQVHNLQRILSGTVPEYELDMRLAEIEVMSENETDADELRATIEYARAQYYLAVEKNVSDAIRGVDDITLNDLEEVHQIVDERLRQLETGI